MADVPERCINALGRGCAAIEVEERRQPYLAAEVDASTWPVWRLDHLGAGTSFCTAACCLPFLVMTTASATQPRENRRKPVPHPGAVEVKVDYDAGAIFNDEVALLEVRDQHPIGPSGTIQLCEAVAYLGPRYSLGIPVRPSPPLVSEGHEQDSQVVEARRRMPRIPPGVPVVVVVVDDLTPPWVRASRSR